MLKINTIIFCLLSFSGCQPPRDYTTHVEYTEEHKWDREKGLIRNSKAFWTMEWNNKK